MTMVEMDQVFASVDAPPVTAYRYGLFSVVPPAADAASDWEGFGITWSSVSCATPRVTLNECVTGAEVDPLVFDTVCTNPEFQTFTVYAGTKGTMRRRDSLVTMTRDRLLEVEQFGVEAELWALLGAAVTEVAQTSLVAGLALVEQMLVEAYPGQGIIHMSRYAAIRLGDQLRQDGGRLVTLLGTPVVAGGGYDQVAGVAPTTVDIYGSGPLVLRRGQVHPPEAITTPGTNDVVALAQRTYAVGWDCAAVGVTVTL